MPWMPEKKKKKIGWDDLYTTLNAAKFIKKKKKRHSDPVYIYKTMLALTEGDDSLIFYIIFFKGRSLSTNMIS